MAWGCVLFKSAITWSMVNGRQEAPEASTTLVAKIRIQRPNMVRSKDDAGRWRPSQIPPPHPVLWYAVTGAVGQNR